MAEFDIEVPFEIKIPTGLQGGVQSPSELNNGAAGATPDPKKEDIKPVEPLKVEPPKIDGKNEDGLTDEQVQTKLDDLATKEETALTEEDKKFIEKYVPTPDEVTSAKQVLEEKLGITFDKTYENSPVGLQQLAEDASKVKATQLVQGYFESIPFMKEFYEHIVVEKRGIETFLTKNIDPPFKSIKLEATSEGNDATVNEKIVSNQKSLLKLDLTAKGVPEDDADTLIDTYEDKGTLFDKAKEAYKSLETKHKSNLDARLAEEEAKIKAEEESFKQTFNQMQQMIDKNDFGGISLPAADIKGFKEAMLKPVDDEGRTIMDYKRAKLTLAQRAIIDYLVFKDLKVTGLGAASAAAANTAKTFSFKKAAQENDKRNGGRVAGANSTTEEGSKPMDIRNINFGTIKVERQ